MAQSLNCPHCKTALSPSAKFCSECGAKITLQSSPRPASPAGERRQATILFADITGYTRLSSELDPEELHALLGRYFGVVDGIIRDFGGTVDKHIGDAVMGVFGAPVSHGNDPERAVRAALSMHAAISELSKELGRPLSIHVGVASGEVMAAATGSDVHREYTVLGDAVNLASRLDGLAGAGETVISAGVQQAVMDMVESEAGGEVTVKGLAEPVRVFRVRALREPTALFRTPFVARRAELATFHQLLDEAARGRGAVLHLRGEPGIGKTRLCAEMRELARKSGFSAHTGLVLDFGTGRGQDAIRALVRSVLGLLLDAGISEREQVLEAALAARLFRDQELPAAYDLMSLPLPPGQRSAYEALSEEKRAAVLRQAVVALLERKSRDQPLLVAVEDVHWCDAQTLSTLSAVAEQSASAAILLVLTSRIDGDPLGEDFRKRTPLARLTRLDLAPLALADAEELASRLGGLDSRRLLACVERCGGNPLFLEHLVFSDAEGVLPDSVQSLVQARMDRLHPNDKRALQAAAVIGQRFSLELLRHLVEDADYHCGALLERGLVRPEGDGWLFAHALVRDGVYSSLLRQGRRDLHRRAGNWFGNSDPVLRAEHLDRAEDEAAARAYVEAAKARVAAFEYAHALVLLERGAELAQSAADRYEVAYREGELMLYRAESQRAVAAFERAAENAQTDAERCRAWIGLADAHRIVEATVPARAALESALSLVAPSGMDQELSRIYRIMGSLKFAQAEDSRGEQEKALEFALRAGSVELEARALSCLGDAYYMACRVGQAREYFGRCVDLCRQHGLGRVEMYQHYMFGMASMLMCDCRGAVASIELGVEQATRSGHRRAEMIARETLGLVLIETAEYERAVAELDRALVLAQDMRSNMFKVVLFAEKAEALLRWGREDEARDALSECASGEVHRGWWFVKPMLGSVVAWLAPSREAMDQELDRAEREMGSGWGMMQMLFHSRVAEACLERGHWLRAERHAQLSLEKAAEMPSVELQMRRILALVEYARGSRAPELLARLAELRDRAERGAMHTTVMTIDRGLARAQRGLTADS